MWEHVYNGLVTVVSLAIRQRSKDPKHLTPGNEHPENRVSMYKNILDSRHIQVN